MAGINESDSWEAELTITYDDAVGSTPATPVDFTAAPSFIVAVYVEGGRIIKKFSKIAQPDFTTLPAASLVNAANGKINLFLNSEETKKADPGRKVYAEVSIGLDNANFDASTQRVTVTDIELEIVSKPVLRNFAL